jgi:hypothetical protein
MGAHEIQTLRTGAARHFSRTCATCGCALAQLSPVEWIDALNNKAATAPFWHEHSPEPRLGFVHPTVRALRQVERLMHEGVLPWNQYRSVVEAIEGDVEGPAPSVPTRPTEQMARELHQVNEAYLAGEVTRDEYLVAVEAIRPTPRVVSDEQFERIDRAFWGAVIAEFPALSAGLGEAAMGAWDRMAREAVEAWLETATSAVPNR